MLFIDCHLSLLLFDGSSSKGCVSERKDWVSFCWSSAEKESVYPLGGGVREKEERKFTRILISYPLSPVEASSNWITIRCPVYSTFKIYFIHLL